jgi:hypothetical protein
MKTFIKLTLTALAIATLAGCASVPQAPKDAQEMAALGDDNLLNVPVDITGFIPSKVKIIATNEDVGQTTIFTNPSNGKTYDFEGQPVNAKGERILKNGHVCTVVGIYGNRRFYGHASVITSNDEFVECRTTKSASALRSKQFAITGGLALGGLGGVAVMGASRVNDEYLMEDILRGDSL